MSLHKALLLMALCFLLEFPYAVSHDADNTSYGAM